MGLYGCSWEELRLRQKLIQAHRSFMFNTGDFGRWNEYGTLEHFGRVDHQVKIKGFRVELDGVDSAMESCPGIKAAAALLVDGVLWGFFAPSNIKIEAVKAATAHVQPYYAVPAHFRPLDSLPETSNGKIDRRILEQHAKDALATEIVLARQAPTSGEFSKASISTGFDLPLDEKESITISSLEEQKHIGYDCNEDTFPKKTQ
ncbi:hypothetical protein H0H87_006622, partial [Tephrocybe sp. NHM501043]